MCACLYACACVSAQVVLYSPTASQEIHSPLGPLLKELSAEAQQSENTPPIIGLLSLQSFSPI